ncbi:MAG: formimidoylglutamate deiminase [Caulobacteraceae bacterium]
MGSLWFETALLPEGWRRSVRLHHVGGKITAVEIGVARDAGEDGGAIGLPGLGNVHSHAFQRGMAGLAETHSPGGDDFWSWRETMYRFVDRMTPEDVQAVAAMAYAEMLESGFTRVGEFHYLHHDLVGAAYGDVGEMAGRVAAATQETGIGLTLLPVFYAQGGFDRAPPSPAQRRFVNTIDGYARLMEASRRAVAGLPDAVVGVAPHSLRAVTPEQLALVTPMARGGPIHIHIAETTREVDDCLAWSGARPVSWLLDHAAVDEDWCLVHATHVSETELARLAEIFSGVVGLCPITEANLGDGVFPAAEFVDEAGYFAIGSDSNVLIDAAEELRTLEYGQRLTRRRRNVMFEFEWASVGRALFVGALGGGAQALGAWTDAGIRIGASADLIGLDETHPSLLGRREDALLDSWIFAARGGAVRTVWRRGEKVVSGGRHVRRDAIVAAYGRSLAHLLEG